MLRINSAVHPGFTLWFTGLSGSGKSTLSARVADEIRSTGRAIQVLDGDLIRARFGALGFGKSDRDLNVRRIGGMCEELCGQGIIAVAAVISPYAAAREEVRRMVSRHGDRFVEVFTRCPLEVLIARDPKGLYRKAMAGELQHFTGISDPYEEPQQAELTIETSQETIAESAGRIMAYLDCRGLLGARAESGSDASVSRT